MGNKNACQNASASSDYDVFINHRGPDVKATFATELYCRLDACGFRVFLDKPKMQVGDSINCQIKHAIETSAIQIAIFSPTYAQSRWCLEELHQMLKSCKSDRAILIPVFYSVKPSRVRCMANELCAEALDSHEKKQKCNPKIIQGWKDDLTHAAGISGLELEASNGGDKKLLGEVVGRVLDLREKKRLNCVTKEDFESIVLSGQRLKNSCKAKVVAIVGPGGIGKTTLVKEFFDTKRSEYSLSCFLSDVKENTTEGSLISMQKKLLKDLTQFVVEIDTIDQGINTLKKHLSSSNVLIILDDVDDAAQMDAVLPIRDVLGSNSFILVTSRHKNVFERRITEVSIYYLMGLNTESPRTKLVLAGHWLKELPPWLDQLTSLKELWLRDSPDLKYLSSSFQQLNQLTELTIMECGIQSLLHDLEKMNNLKVFRVYNCPLGKLSFGKLSKLLRIFFPQVVYPHLQHIWINSCRDLVKVKSLPTSLITLDLSYCNGLRQIKGLHTLSRLERLDISGCEEIEELPKIHLLTSLKELKASRCYKLKRLANLGTKLRILYLRECREILELPGVERLMSLEKLDASRCPKLQFGREVLVQLRQRLKADLLL